MDFFTCLPTPLPFLILTAIPDFDTLHNIIHASPSAFKTFCDAGSEIIDTVAANTLEIEDHFLLNSTARIRANGISHVMTSLAEVERTYLLHRPPQSKPETLSAGIPLHLLLGLVATAANIQRLTLAVLDELLSRVSNIKPMHAVNRAISFSSNTYLPGPAGSAGWPEGIMVPQPSNPRAPSWVEGSRVQTGLWTLQVALDIRQHANWLNWNLPTHIISNGGWYLNKISTVEPYARNSSLVARVLQYITQERNPDHASWSINSPSFLVLKYMPTYNNTLRLDTGWRLPEKPKDDQVGKDWGQDRNSAHAGSNGIQIWSRLLFSRHLRLTPDMLKALFELGMTLWDRQRLWELGLIDEPESIRGGAGDCEYISRGRSCWMSDDEITYAWCSVAWNHVLDTR